MHFKIDENKRKEFVQTAIKNNKYLDKLHKLHKILFVSGIVSLIPALLAQNKILIFSLILIGVAICCKGAVLSIAGKNLLDRKNETLIIRENILTYSYRKKWTMLSTERERIVVHLDDINNIEVDNDTGRIKIIGNITQFQIQLRPAYDFPLRDEILSKKKISEFVLYDYINPSLRDMLGDKIHREGWNKI